MSIVPLIRKLIFERASLYSKGSIRSPGGHYFIVNQASGRFISLNYILKANTTDKGMKH